MFDGKPSPGFAVSGLGVTHRSMKGAESGGPEGQELSGAAHSQVGDGESLTHMYVRMHARMSYLILLMVRRKSKRTRGSYSSHNSDMLSGCRKQPRRNAFGKPGCACLPSRQKAHHPHRSKRFLTTAPGSRTEKSQKGSVGKTYHHCAVGTRSLDFCCLLTWHCNELHF